MGVGSSVELSIAPKQEHKVLKCSMTSVCMMYGVPLQELLDTVDQFADDISKEGPVFTCYP